MFWRVLLFVYLATFGTLLWLGWAVIQTITGGRAYHAPRPLGDPADEKPRRSNCFLWAIWRFVNEGGEFHIRSSPRLPVWRAEWSDRKGSRWHFEPTYPKRGTLGIWHTYWHQGEPRIVTGKAKRRSS